MSIGVRLFTAVVAASLGASACTSISGPGTTAVVMRTDRDEYVASYQGGEGSYREYGFTLAVRIENRGSSTVYLSRCYPDSPHPVYSVALVDGEDRWGAAYNHFWACVGHDRQIRLGPGQVRTDTLYFRGPSSFDGRTGEAFGSLIGRMQLRYEVQTCRGDGACRLGRDAGVSNVFTVDLAALS